MDLDLESSPEHVHVVESAGSGQPEALADLFCSMMVGGLVSRKKLSVVLRRSTYVRRLLLKNPKPE